MSSSIDNTQTVAAKPPDLINPQSETQAMLERLLGDFLSKLPEVDRRSLSELLRALAAHPDRSAEIHGRYYREQLALWSELLTAGSVPGQPAGTEPVSGDHRFDSPEWRTIPWFDFLKRSYLINARWLTQLLDAVPLPSDKRQRAAFVLRQCLDAMAPTNFPATNPEVLRLAAESRGASLARGLEHLRQDLARGRMQMSERSAFEIGRNIAVTPGAVVYQNPIMQLIQYTPTTPQVSHRPLLVVPPFINKYYILDLQPENSFVRYALDQGLQVFLVSWRNIPRELGGATWEDYIRHGVYAPLKAMREITGANEINALGFCVGGTLLACALAVMENPQQVASLTLLATMLDFTDVGEIGVYVDEQYVRQCEDSYLEGGLMPGSMLASAFASLRANDLVWSFVINNYLKGKTPRAFDLLHWNGDSANLPGSLYAWYLRNTYLENNLCMPGKLTLCGRPLDLGAIHCPAYILAAREDHIVPWRSAYANTQLLPGKIDFVLAASGHVAGIVNPPAAGRRSYWIGEDTPADASEWLAHAGSMAGSWWTHWSAWLKQHSGTLVAAPRTMGGARHQPIERAPGSYVREVSG